MKFKNPFVSSTPVAPAPVESVDSIVSDFNAKVQQLNKLSERMQAKAAKEDEVIARATASKEKALAESGRALNVAGKISTLIGL